MGHVHSIPKEEITGLLDATHFNKIELKRWYQQFMKDFPDGKMNEEQFFKIYGDLFASEANMGENIFRSFDLNRDGSISFRELMMTLSLTTVGTKEEKLEWLFNVYDFDGNGKITVDEVRALADTFSTVLKRQSMRRLSCDVHHCEHDSDSDEEEDFISCMFDDVDGDHNGYWTLEEFVKGVEVHPVLMKINLSVKTTS